MTIFEILRHISFASVFSLTDLKFSSTPSLRIRTCFLRSIEHHRQPLGPSQQWLDVLWGQRHNHKRLTWHCSYALITFSAKFQQNRHPRLMSHGRNRFTPQKSQSKCEGSSTFLVLEHKAARHVAVLLFSHHGFLQLYYMHEYIDIAHYVTLCREENQRYCLSVCVGGVCEYEYRTLNEYILSLLHRLDTLLIWFGSSRCGRGNRSLSNSKIWPALTNNVPTHLGHWAHQRRYIG